MSALAPYRGWSVDFGTGIGPRFYATHPDFDGESTGLQVNSDTLVDLYAEVDAAVAEFAA